MVCFDCGNCKGEDLTYYCAAKGQFIIKDEIKSVEKERGQGGWKKGDQRYEFRRKIRKSGDDLKEIV